MTVPLRRTPARFRWWFAGCLVALVAGFVGLHLFAPGPDLSTIARQPGALMLLALIVLADFYPTLPWMRGSNPFDEFIFSTPLAIAALMVFGPHAAIVFVIAGFAMPLALRMRWWRIVLNTALWGVVGVAAAGVLALVWHSAGWADQMPENMMIPMTILLAAVIECLNLVLVMTSQYLAAATTPRAYLADWRSQIAIGTLDLTAPIPAALAAAQPALLPLLAVAMVAAQAGLGAVTSRTAQAGTDPLTSVPNRAYLLTRIKSRLAAPEVDRHAVTVLLIDLDRFKQINDDLGHLVGDQVLVEVARRLEESTRSSDVVARFGGDEFAVLLTGGSGQRNVAEVAARIRAAVNRPIQVAGQSIQVGVTIGWALADRHDTDPLMLLQRADARLYAAKAARGPETSLPAQHPGGLSRAEARASGEVGAPMERKAGAAVPPAEESYSGPIWSSTPGRLIGAHDGSAPAATAP
ncbi:MAG TPA: GGDEF domain-containing protein [Nakamurella sp.]